MNTQQLWQAQALDAPRISLDFLRQQLDGLRRRTQRRNAFEYISGAAGILFMVWVGVPLLNGKPLMQLALVLWMAGVGLVAFLWHRHNSSQQPPAELGVLDTLRFYRRQLERQRDARSGNWRWWLPPYIPGVAMTFVGLLTEYTPPSWLAIGLTAAWIGVGFSVAIVCFERSARRIQREIDALDAL